VPPPFIPTFLEFPFFFLGLPSLRFLFFLVFLSSFFKDCYFPFQKGKDSLPFSKMVDQLGTILSPHWFFARSLFYTFPFRLPSFTKISGLLEGRYPFSYLASSRKVSPLFHFVLSALSASFLVFFTCSIRLVLFAEILSGFSLLFFSWAQISIPLAQVLSFFSASSTCVRMAPMKSLYFSPPFPCLGTFLDPERPQNRVSPFSPQAISPSARIVTENHSFRGLLFAPFIT